MSIYTQQASSLMERLPEAEQKFVLEFIKKISIRNSYSNKSLNVKQLNENQRETVKKFIEGVNSADNEILDDEFDEIIENRINITRKLDL